MAEKVLSLFEGYGIEIEYMIVRQDTLDVAAAADWLLATESGAAASELERNDYAWTNELARHVIELKTNGPAPTLANLASGFHAEVQHINRLLHSEGMMLLPTGMHPWMNPLTEVQLWPFEQNDIYQSFDRIFSCRGHGWGNLQSVHLNLPFADDDQFGRLHAAIRLVLPLLPAIAASSPFMDGQNTRVADTRLKAYERNCARIPSITGSVIPEPIFTMAEYQDNLLAGLYRDIAPYDPEGALQQEWLNARGAIARFDRMALEIRLLDVQECTRADLAIVEVVAETVRQLSNERWSTATAQQLQQVAPLKALLDRCISTAEDAVIDSRDYLRLLGWQKTSEVSAGRLWEHLVETAASQNSLSADGQRVLEHYLRHGTLASRLARRVQTPSREQLRALYQDVARCLADGELFV